MKDGVGRHGGGYAPTGSRSRGQYTAMLSTCCCGKCLLRTGSICTAVCFLIYRLFLVAVLVVAFLFFEEIDDSVYEKKRETLWIMLLVTIGVNALDVLLTIGLTVGVVKGRSLPILIWIIYETLNVVFLVITIVVFMILTQFRTQFIIAFVASLILSAFKLYLILAIVSYYQYLASGVSTITTSR